MKCKEARLRISLLADSRLDERRRSELDAHLSSCAECRAEMKLVGQMTSALESLATVEPRAGGWERLTEQIEDARPARRSLVPAYAFACVLVVATIAVILLFAHADRELVKAPEPVRETVVVRPTLPAPRGEHHASSSGRRAASGEQKAENGPSIAVDHGSSITHHASARPPRTVHKHHSPRRVRAKPELLEAPSPVPVEEPAEEPTEEPVEEQVPEQYLAQVEPAAEPSEISYAADRLLARGLSVLVEASAVETGAEEDNHL